VLECKDGCWDENRYLFAVIHGLECRPYRHLGLPETHIAANQAIHGLFTFHVRFDILGSLALVRCILVQEGSLKLVLQVAVGGLPETLL
jgi:hypothetical protein